MLGPCDQTYPSILNANDPSSQICAVCGCLNPYAARSIRLTYRSCLRCSKQLRTPTEWFGFSQARQAIGGTQSLRIVHARLERYDDPSQYSDLTDAFQRVVQGRGGDSLEIGLTVDLVAMAGRDPALGTGKVLSLCMVVRSKMVFERLRVVGSHLERPFTIKASVLEAPSTGSRTCAGEYGAQTTRLLELQPAGCMSTHWAPSVGATQSVTAPVAARPSDTAEPRPRTHSDEKGRIMVVAASIGDPVRSDRAVDVTKQVQARIDSGDGRSLLLSACDDLSRWLPNPCKHERMRLAIRYIAWSVDAEAVRDVVPCMADDIAPLCETDIDATDAVDSSSDRLEAQAESTHQQSAIGSEAGAGAGAGACRVGFRLEAGLKIEIPPTAPTVMVHSAVWGHVHDAAAQLDVALRLRSFAFECEPAVWATVGQPRTLSRSTRARIRRRRVLLARFRRLARTAGCETEAVDVGRQLAHLARPDISDRPQIGTVSSQSYSEGFSMLGRRCDALDEDGVSTEDSSDDDYAVAPAASRVASTQLYADIQEKSITPKGQTAKEAKSAEPVHVASAAEADQLKLRAFATSTRLPLEVSKGAGPAVPLDGRDLMLAVVPPPRPGDPHPLSPMPQIPTGLSEFRDPSSGSWVCLRRGWDASEMFGDPCPGQTKVLRIAWEMASRSNYAQARERNGRLLNGFMLGSPVVAPRVAITRAQWFHASGTGVPVDVTVLMRRRLDCIGGSRAFVLPNENIYKLLRLDRNGHRLQAEGAKYIKSARQTGTATTIKSSSSSSIQDDRVPVGSINGSTRIAPSRSDETVPAFEVGDCITAVPSHGDAKWGDTRSETPTRSTHRLAPGSAARLGLGETGLQALRTVDPHGAEGAMTRRMTSKGGGAGASTGFRHILDLEVLVDGVRGSHRRLLDTMETTLRGTGARAAQQSRQSGLPLLPGCSGEGIMVDAGQLTAAGGEPPIRIDRAVWGHPIDPDKRADVRMRLQSALQRTRDGLRLDMPKGSLVNSLLGDPCPGTWRELHVRWSSAAMSGSLYIPAIEPGQPLGFDVRIGWPPPDELLDSSRRQRSFLRSLHDLIASA